MSESTSRVLSEVQAGDGLSLSGVGRTIPGHRGKPTMNPRSVLRWVRDGTITPSGRRVKLEACRVGNRWLTSNSAVARYVQALTDDSEPAATPAVQPTRTDSARRRAAENAAAKLIARGA